MRKLLVFQHAATEPLGVLDPMLRRWGFRIRYVNFARDPQARPDVGRYNGLVVLGGPMNVDQGEHFGTRAYGLQFHLEADEALIRRWLAVPAYRAEVDTGHMEGILRDTHNHIGAALRVSEKVFGDFIELFSWRPKKKIRLESR